MELGQPIAVGRTAEVYAWEHGKVLKLYFDWFPQGGIEYEQSTARAVVESGVPSPAVGEIVQVNGRSGLVYQRLEGSTMLENLMRAPWRVFAYARRMADLHAQMHAKTAGLALPAQRPRLAEKIRTATTLPEALRARTLAALEQLPDGDRLTHGDFHPGNIMLASSGAVTIDWIDAARGNPLADVARTTILLRGVAATGQGGSPLLTRLALLFHGAYLRRYFTLRPGGREEYRRWLPVVAAARLNEEIQEIEGWLVAQVEQGLYNRS